MGSHTGSHAKKKAAAIARAAENVSSGKTLAEPLRACGQFPREILEMISVAEQANRLEVVLVDLAEKLEQKVHRRLDVFMKLLEPSLMLVMAVLVGFLVVALLLPVFEGSSGASGKLSTPSIRPCAGTAEAWRPWRRLGKSCRFTTSFPSGLEALFDASCVLRRDWSRIAATSGTG